MSTRETILLVTLVILFASPLGFAGIVHPSEVDQIIASAGVTYQYSGKLLTITVDVNKALNAIPSMQKAGAVNPHLSLQDVRRLPVSISVSVVGMFYTAGILQQLFAVQNDVNEVQVQGYLTTVNEYGVSDKKACFQFDFNRELYQKINWENFVGASLIAITPHFSFSSWCQAVLANEAGRQG